MSNGLDFAERFQCSSAFDQQSVARAGRKARGNRRGGRDHQGARAGDEQGRKTPVNPGRPVTVECQRRNEDDEQRDHHGGRCVPEAEPIDHPRQRSLRFLRLLDHLDDAGNRIVGCGSGDFDAQLAVGVDAPREYFCTDLLEDGNRFSCDWRLVYLGCSIDDPAVGRHPVTGSDNDNIANLQGLH